MVIFQYERSAHYDSSTTFLECFSAQLTICSQLEKNESASQDFRSIFLKSGLEV